MKFGKQLKDNVPSAWQQKCIDYALLKSLIKQISLACEEAGLNSHTHPAASQFRGSILRRFNSVNSLSGLLYDGTHTPRATNHNSNQQALIDPGVSDDVNIHNPKDPTDEGPECLTSEYRSSVASDTDAVISSKHGSHATEIEMMRVVHESEQQKQQQQQQRDPVLITPVFDESAEQALDSIFTRITHTGRPKEMLESELEANIERLRLSNHFNSNSSGNNGNVIDIDNLTKVEQTERDYINQLCEEINKVSEFYADRCRFFARRADKLTMLVQRLINADRHLNHHKLKELRKGSTEIMTLLLPKDAIGYTHHQSDYEQRQRNTQDEGDDEDGYPLSPIEREENDEYENEDENEEDGDGDDHNEEGHHPIDEDASSVELESSASPAIPPSSEEKTGDYWRNKNDYHTSNKEGERTQSALSLFQSSAMIMNVRSNKQGRKGSDYNYYRNHHLNTKRQLRLERKKLRKLIRIEFNTIQILSQFRTLMLTALIKINKKHDKNSYIIRNLKQLLIDGYLSSNHTNHMNHHHCDCNFNTSSFEKYLLNRHEKLYLLTIDEFNHNNHNNNNNKKKETHKSLLLKLRQQPSTLKLENNSFLFGLYSGASITILLAIILVLFTGANTKNPSQLRLFLISNWFTFHGFLMFKSSLLLSWYLLLYGFNVWIFRSYRLNYHFIMDLDRTTSVTETHILRIGARILLLTLINALIYVSCVQLYHPNEIYVSSSDIKWKNKWLNLGMISLLMLIIIWLLFIIFPGGHHSYHSARSFLFKSLFKLIRTPFSKVRFVDSFLADQLTSLFTIFVDLTISMCLFSTLSFLRNEQSQFCDKDASLFFNLLRITPFWIRFGQCLRRFAETSEVVIRPSLNNTNLSSSPMATRTATTTVTMVGNPGITDDDEHDNDDKDVENPASMTLDPHDQLDYGHYSWKDVRWQWVHFANACKYGLAILTAIVSAVDKFIHRGHSVRKGVVSYIHLTMAVISTMYALFWDLNQDWGFFHIRRDDWPKSGSYFSRFTAIVLRNDRKFPEWVYLSAIVSNTLFRAGWAVALFPQAFGINPQLNHYMSLVLAMIEVLRRAVWNVLRMENEAVNNSGGFRLVKDIPDSALFHPDQTLRRLSRADS